MKEYDVGFLPICHDDRIIGVLTDRDIVIKLLAMRPPRDWGILSARDIMSSPAIYAYESDDISAAIQLMKAQRIRRLIVLDQRKRLVGVATLGDIAVKARGANRSP